MIRTNKYIFYLFLNAMVFSSCAVISTDIRNEINPHIVFKDMIQTPSRFEGETVILGGYILSTQGDVETSIITVLQAPLRFGDEPGPRDFSEGRFMVVHTGYLDPEVYSKNRRITVAGRIISCKDQGNINCHSPYLKIESRELHLWPEYEHVYPYPYPNRHRYNRYHPYRYHDPHWFYSW